jgi:hypothetical protein
MSTKLKEELPCFVQVELEVEVEKEGNLAG